MPYLLIWLLAEIAVFILVGDLIGVLWTLTLIVLTTLLGIALLRSQSMSAMKKMQDALKNGKPPVSMDMSMPFRVMGGMLLIIPGFITDAIGLLLLIPGIPGFMFKRVKVRNNRRKAQNDDTIEGECWEDKPDAKQIDEDEPKS